MLKLLDFGQKVVFSVSLFSGLALSLEDELCFTIDFFLDLGYNMYVSLRGILSTLLCERNGRFYGKSLYQN